MDGFLAIEHNREALKRVLLMLIAMAGGEATLPRHLYRAVLRLLRPAESAARRLIIALSRGFVVTMPEAWPPFDDRSALAPSTGIRMASVPVRVGSRSQPPALPLLDPPHQSFLRPWVRHAAMPRISVPGYIDPCPIPARPSRYDPMDATRLRSRLAALSSALDDLPRRARRFARWRARREWLHGLGQARRRWPLRPGRPPGFRKRPSHEVFEILQHANRLARFALENPDSS